MNMEKQYSEDYYKMLQDENYKTLLDREIQLNNARERAMKQSNSNLNALGLASAGYGQTAKSGIESQYLSALGQANDTYQAQTEENLKATKDYTNARFNNFLNELGSYDLSTNDKRNQVLSNYGLMNEDGTINQEEFNKMYGEDNWGAFKSTLDQYGTTSAEENGLNIQGKADEKRMKATKDEREFLTGKGAEISKNFKNGDYIKLSDNTKDKNNVYYVYKDGNLVEVTKEEYDKGSHKYWVRSHENTKSMIVDYDGKTIYDGFNSDVRDFEKGAAITQGVLSLLTGNPMGIGQVIAGNAILDAANYPNNKKTKSNYEAYLEAMKNG